MTPVFFYQCMSGCTSMKTTQLACTPDVAIAAQRNFGPLHCDGKHKHASLLGGRDELTNEFPSRATATYTGDACALPVAASLTLSCAVLLCSARACPARPSPCLPVLKSVPPTPSLIPLLRSLTRLNLGQACFISTSPASVAA